MSGCWYACVGLQGFPFDTACIMIVRPGLNRGLSLLRFRAHTSLPASFQNACRLGVHCRSAITRCHIRWLSLHAFLRVLQRKQASYKPLLAALSAELREKQYCLLPAQLAGVVDRRRSAAFDSIIY